MKISLALLVLALAAPSRAAVTQAAAAELRDLRAKQAIFAPIDLAPDLSKLPESERKALAKMIEAAELMNGLFLRQTWAGSESMLASLAADESDFGRARLKLFLTHKGPWDRTDHNKAFVPGAPEKPAQASFYPSDASKEEVEKWIESLPAAEKAQANGFFTVIKRVDGKLAAVPYSVEYQNELLLAAEKLREAAALTAQPTLKTFLEKRAAAFLSNDYYDSDVAWMELDASIEPTIGPYETYEDEWFGYKAAFEAFITLRDDAETAKLSKFGENLQWLEDRLPVEKAWRNPKLGALAPLKVVNQVYASGDAARGVATAAFNLPNDEKVTREKGAKRTMLKNVQEAKFNTVLVPLSALALPPAQRALVSFDAFFTHILMHEVMHGLGPHEVKEGALKGDAVRKTLKDTYSAIEEAKADASGLWALQQLVDKGVLDKQLEKTMYVTFLASSFRTLRFGINEAHGKGMALQLNYLLDKGAFVVNADGTFSVDEKKIKGAFETLTRELMTLQAKGDYAGAKAWLEKMAVLRPEAAAVLAKAKGLPVDIAPRHRAAEDLVGR